MHFTCSNWSHALSLASPLHSKTHTRNITTLCAAKRRGVKQSNNTQHPFYTFWTKTFSTKKAFSLAVDLSWWFGSVVVAQSPQTHHGSIRCYCVGPDGTYISVKIETNSFIFVVVFVGDIVWLHSLIGNCCTESHHEQHQEMKGQTLRWAKRMEIVWLFCEKNPFVINANRTLCICTCACSAGSCDVDNGRDFHRCRRRRCYANRDEQTKKLKSNYSLCIQLISNEYRHCAMTLSSPMPFYRTPRYR